MGEIRRSFRTEGKMKRVCVYSVGPGKVKCIHVMDRYVCERRVEDGDGPRKNILMLLLLLLFTKYADSRNLLPVILRLTRSHSHCSLYSSFH